MNAATQTTRTTPNDINLTDLQQWKNLEEIEAQNPNFTVSSLRWLLRNRERNGLDAITKKLGKNWLVHAQGLSVWVSTRD